MTAAKRASLDGNKSRFSPSFSAGGFVFVSGQAAVGSDGQIVPGTFEEEMRRSFDNVIGILANLGLGLGDVVKVGAYLQRAEDLPEYNRIYAEYFQPPLPARTTLTNCLTERIKFELDVIAYAGDSRPSTS
ncbi:MULTISPECIES: RidA family protein [Amycolatopsis]|uniref:RidA family protein n=1 Tax=Amycolatopsis tucumanensis TaxID=401106 RepID=A0ABP7I4T8_9PSEU|nr:MULTISPECIES: RidA family protein [Amycolatopsis]MCF6426187.1 RidA family protein [Amycolatopsis tucumanensis]